MAEPKMTLPPFAALKAFHAAATHERYRDAAEALGITESAVSHQLRKLEEFLHTSLMDRSGNRPKLTDAGRQYLDQIAPAMRQIHGATVALLPASGRSAVRLTLPPSLAVTWLIPQLSAFERENPQIDMQLNTTPRVVNLVREQFDFAIRYGKGIWTDVEATFLLDEVAMPVCAPGYLDADPAAPMADSLAGSRIIVNAYNPDEWVEWAGAHRIELPSLGDMITFDALEQALQVAESGHGIAMGRRPMVDAWLESGRLVAPFGGGEPTGTAYYLCRPEGATPTAAARRLERWLMDLAQN